MGVPNVVVEMILGGPDRCDASLRIRAVGQPGLSLGYHRDPTVGGRLQCEPHARDAGANDEKVRIQDRCPRAVGRDNRPWPWSAISPMPSP